MGTITQPARCFVICYRLKHLKFNPERNHFIMTVIRKTLLMKCPKYSDILWADYAGVLCTRLAIEAALLDKFRYF